MVEQDRGGSGRPGRPVNAGGRDLPRMVVSGWRWRLVLALALLPIAAVVPAGQDGPVSRGFGGASAQDGTPTPPLPTPFPGIPAPQPSYETLRVEAEGAVVPYHVWIDWLPSLVTTPGGGGWVFFGAQARTSQGLGARQLYAARFDPERGVWMPATLMPGGVAQFGSAAAVDSTGTVHVVYSDVAAAGEVGSTLVYTRSTPEGGWADPMAVAPDPDAGYQMMADIAIDANDGVHVLWRDQRLVTAEERAAHPANGDLFVSDLVDGAWTPPVKVMERDGETAVAGWPHLAANGDRLVAIWSIYGGTTEEDMKSADRIDQASRPLDDPASWSAASPLLVRPDDSREIGGRLVDVATVPGGGIVIIYGSYERARNELAVRRLGADNGGWSEPEIIATGDYGYLPTVAVNADGTLFAAFNAGRNRNVKIGAMAVSPDGNVATPVTLTPAEAGLQARAMVAVGADGNPWIVYMHQPPGESAVTELRVLREAILLQTETSE